MELPAPFATLYRHWPEHAADSPDRPAPQGLDTTVLTEMTRFIRERLSIWEKKVAGATPPYTDDPILRRYRFCNVFRELDAQTVAFHELLSPLRNDFPLWLLNMFYCRLVARPETLRHVGLLSFDEADNRNVYGRLMASPRPRFGTPYVFPVSAIIRSSTPTRELFLTRAVPERIPGVADDIATWKKMPVHDGLAKVLPIFGYNLAFLWTEVLIDVAYQFPDRIDLFSRFPVGPGSAPTLRRLHPARDPTLLVEDLCGVPFETGLTFNGLPLRLSAENWEGMACEFRKYGNLRAGKGRRRVYDRSA